MIEPDEIAANMGEDARVVVRSLPDGWVAEEDTNASPSLLAELQLWLPKGRRAIDAVPLLICQRDQSSGRQSYRLSTFGERVREVLRSREKPCA